MTEKNIAELEGKCFGAGAAAVFFILLAFPIFSVSAAAGDACGGGTGVCAAPINCSRGGVTAAECGTGFVCCPTGTGAVGTGTGTGGTAAGASCNNGAGICAAPVNCAGGGTQSNCATGYICCATGGAQQGTGNQNQGGNQAVGGGAGAAQAQGGGATTCPAGYQLRSGVCFPTNTGLSEKPVSEIIRTFMTWLLGLVGTIAIIAFVVSGLQYLLAAGDEKTIESAKRTMKWSIVGVIVALGALVIINAVIQLLSANPLI